MSRVILIGCVVIMAGCFSTRRLPPPEAPARVEPAVDQAGSPAPGLGRVLLDVEGDRAVVESISGGSMSAVGGGRAFAGSLEVSRRLCMTPCYVDLAPGPNTLRFTSVVDAERTGDGYVNVDSGVSAYRYSLGLQRRRYLRRSAAWLTAIVAGVVDLVALQVVLNDDIEASTGEKIGTVGVGVAFTALAWWLFDTSGSVSQEGNGVQWAVPARGTVSSR